MTTNTRTIPFTGTSQTTGHTPTRESINHHPGILDRMLRRTNTHTRQLEQVVDITSNIEIGANSRIDSLNPRQLWNAMHATNKGIILEIAQTKLISSQEKLS